MTDAELCHRALRRYGSEHVAGKLAIVRQVHADVQAGVEHRRDVSVDVERPASQGTVPDRKTNAP